MNFLSKSFCLVLLSSTVAWSQLHLGVKGGLNYSFVNYVDTRNLDFTASEWIFGGNAGLSAEYGLNDYLSLRAELLFSQKGYGVRKYVNSQLFQLKDKRYSDYWQVTKNYIELPVLINYYFEGEKFRFQLGIGPYMGYWVGGMVNYDLYTQELGSATILQKRISESYEFTNEYDSNNSKDNKIDLGGSTCISIGYKTKKGIFFIDARYNHGITSSKIYQGEIPKNAVAELNQNFTFSFGYMILLIPKQDRTEKEDNSFDESQLDN